MRIGSLENAERRIRATEEAQNAGWENEIRRMHRVTSNNIPEIVVTFDGLLLATCKEYSSSSF